jgi:hypothetical protein
MNALASSETLLNALMSKSGSSVRIAFHICMTATAKVMFAQTYTSSKSSSIDFCCPVLFRDKRWYQRCQSTAS